jgi:hypothetical protein
VTSSKVRLPSYVGRLEELTEKPRLPDEPGVGSAEPPIPNRAGIGSQEPRILNRPGGGWEVFGAGVACSGLVVSRSQFSFQAALF